jgi:hypothetical protein
VKGLLVDIGVDGNGLDAEFLAGPDDAQGDLAAIGDKDFMEHELVSEKRFQALRAEGDQNRPPISGP